MIRTRFAPSPTGYLHIGGARTALFSWAYARRHGGRFVLRIEDTDLERSTEQSVQAILDGMRWLGLDWDEGPIRQMDRLSRYREVADELVRIGRAYPCYCSRQELDEMREEQRARGEKPRYDGRWRPENARHAGLVPPAGVQPVLRFRNPDDGEVVFHDEIKGDIRFANAELDDLVILRADGVPTYNFGVVVDDLDMSISHVIRGDDHVNNTPRQVNIIQALGGTMPRFAHVPMILGADGERLSKRHGAVSVMQYAEDGYLPEAIVNYLARLGWSHGDAEIFSVPQLVEWFDLVHVSHSAARFDGDKLRWLNHQYLRQADDARLAALLRERPEFAAGRLAGGPALEAVVALFKDRAETVQALAADAQLFYGEAAPSAAMVEEHLQGPARAALADFGGELARLSEWSENAIAAAAKATLARTGLKMPKLAIPVRVCVFGTPRTPDLAKVLAVAGRERVLARLTACANA
jgi:glutamyl-tRNA synthetase